MDLYLHLFKFCTCLCSLCFLSMPTLFPFQYTQARSLFCGIGYAKGLFFLITSQALEALSLFMSYTWEEKAEDH